MVHPFFHKEFWYNFELPSSLTCKLSTDAATAIKEQDHFHYACVTQQYSTLNNICSIQMKPYVQVDCRYMLPDLRKPDTIMQA